MTLGGPGYGAGPWGEVPWGHAQFLLAGEGYCDIFLFEHGDSMLHILENPRITACADAGQLVPNYPLPEIYDLGMLSGEVGDPSFPTSTAYIRMSPEAGVPADSYTLELTVFHEALPTDFTDITNRHFAFSVSNTTGPCVALFISKQGIAYAGGFHFTPDPPSLGTLVLDSSFQIIPHTETKVPVGEYVTYRIAVSAVTGAVYIFATLTADLDVIGHQLVAVMPVIMAADLVQAPTEDAATISVRGLTDYPSRISLDHWCLSSQFIIPNIAPVANAGQDQAIRLCSIARLDGTASYDPEGAALIYAWRLLDTPAGSEFLVEGHDGTTYPLAIPTGYTNKLHSLTLNALEATDPVLVGDVVTVNGESLTIASKGTDSNGFFVGFATMSLADDYTALSFRVLRQRAISDSTEDKPTFFPDKAGFYKFDLVVYDGALFSDPSIVVLNVLESSLPRGCVPDLGFISGYLSDFWPLVEDIQVADVVWSALAQVAATELYTLWQYEYAKSHRDIQRTIVRRWLHYDLLLAEPLPEITIVRAVWSGVDSTQIPSTGDPEIPGKSLILSSENFTEDLVVATTKEYPVELAAELQRKLTKLDASFTVELIPERADPVTFYVIRINAPFSFTVSEDSTVPVFTPGLICGTISGSGAAVGTRTYVVDKSMTSLGLQEDDLLVIEGIGYRILGIVDGLETDPDAFYGQRISLKDDLPLPTGTSWKIGGLAHSELLDFYNGLVTTDDYLFLEIDDGETTELLQATILGVCASVPSSISFDSTEVGIAISSGYTLRIAKVVRKSYLPISDLIVDIPTLQEHVVVGDAEAVLYRNLDYYLEEYRNTPAIKFVSTPTLDVWEGEVPPSRLWAEYSYINNNEAIEANFGIPADFTLDDLAQLPETIDYLSAVRGLWYAYFNGPTLYDLRMGAQIFLGLPFAEVKGTIEEIREDFSPAQGRILIRDYATTEIVRSYRYPIGLALETNPDTAEHYKVGDVVEQFAPLVEGVDVFDYIKDPEWFKGLLNQGYFTETQKYHTFTVRVNSNVFQLSTLLMVRDFVMRIKPVYTKPIFVVTYKADDCDVDVTDNIAYKVTLHLNEELCGYMGAHMFDDYRAGPVTYETNEFTYGACWNQFDTGDNGGSSPPVYPLSAAVYWGFDKNYLRPEDELAIDLIKAYGGDFTPTFDSVFAFDTDMTYLLQLVESTPPFTIPEAGTGSFLFAGNVPIPSDGTFEATDPEKYNIRLLIQGGPGEDVATDYEFLLLVDYGSGPTVIASFPFDASDDAIELRTVLTGVSLTYPGTVKFGIRIPADSPNPAERTPDWTYISAQAIAEDSSWYFDMGGDTYPAIPPVPAPDLAPYGTYIQRERPLE